MNQQTSENGVASDNLNSLVLQKPSEWAKKLGIVILDPDGWRGKDGRDFEDPISEAEFERRKVISTIMQNNYVHLRETGEK